MDPQSGVPPPEKLIRPVMPELDSLRGAAILLVVFFHGFDLPGGMNNFAGPARLFIFAILTGWTGVYLFFVLSGFLITGILLDSKPKPHYYRRFYIRRALRILPAYYLVLLILCILPLTGWLDHRRIGGPFIALSFAYLSNVTELFGVPAQYFVLWSLAVEEHFYLLWPTVVHAFSRRSVIWCAAGICLACPVIRAVGFRFGYDMAAGYTWYVADSLALGALMGACSRGALAHRRPMRLFSLGCLLSAIALLTIGTPFGIWQGSTFCGVTFRRSAVNLFFAGVLGITLLLGASRFKWIVQRPLLQWFGTISYGLYLIHMLAFDVVDHWLARLFPGLPAQIPSHLGLMFLRFAASMAIAVTLAFLSRQYFEEWFLGLKNRMTPTISSSTAITVDLQKRFDLAPRHSLGSPPVDDERKPMKKDD